MRIHHARPPRCSPAAGSRDLHGHEPEGALGSPNDLALRQTSVDADVPALAAPPLALLLRRPVRERITEPRMGSVVFSQRRRHDRGNLSCHLRKLEDAGDVTITKSFANARPRTTVQLNAQGRAAFDRSTDALGAMLRAIG